MSELENLTLKQFDAFRKFIYRQSGIRIEASKVTLMSNRIRRRVRAGNFADFDAYYRFLTSAKGAGELEDFLDAITTNPTHFFRTPAHFDWFRTDFVTDAIARERAPTNAACESGPPHAAPAKRFIRWRSASPKMPSGCAAGNSPSSAPTSARRSCATPAPPATRRTHSRR